METLFMITQNKTSEPSKFVLNLSQRLNLRSLNEHVALQILSIHYIWNNIGQEYKNNQLRIISLN